MIQKKFEKLLCDGRFSSRYALVCSLSPANRLKESCGVSVTALKPFFLRLFVSNISNADGYEANRAASAGAPSPAPNEPADRGMGFSDAASCECAEWRGIFCINSRFKLLCFRRRDREYAGGMKEGE